MSGGTVPTIGSARTFPKGSAFPSAAVVICPHCKGRHWLQVTAGAPLQHCPVTGLSYCVAVWLDAAAATAGSDGER